MRVIVVETERPRACAIDEALDDMFCRYCAFIPLTWPHRHHRLAQLALATALAISRFIRDEHARVKHGAAHVVN